ncbi:AMP-dependent synthetase and ligase [Glaciecola nitratireducens FR1064]|uniref:AMP-dependent synthetase and ligase n=2 Tax=Brumicola TaxID=3160924 RepID=G4QJ01_GLANF|nr:AMP-dependent synthetase and ligase [Glaciecola nitratireducens FR1064]
MSELIQRLLHIPTELKDQIAVETAGAQVSYTQLAERVTNLSDWLKKQGADSVCLHTDNSIDWIVVDLACQMAELVFTPIPLFFTQAQYDQLLLSVKPNILFSQQDVNFGALCECDLVKLNVYKLVQDKRLAAPNGTSKITYTSGSTGTPKGVCLSTENQMAVACALVNSIGLQNPRHLCLLPLPTLLENIAGVYCPMLASGTVIIASDAERGFEGSRLVNPNALLNCISRAKPNSLILVPELLQVLVMATKNNWQAPSSLQFIAVGGSRVSASLLAEARGLGLPVYQGYGLSECSSVVCINTPNNDDIASTGSVLPHLKAAIINNELVVSGNAFLGYLEDQRSWYNDLVFTGDIASIKNNKIYIEGRIKNTLINSFGRNISPEWIESELLATGLFQQAVVLGDSRPFCMAVLVPISEKIQQAVISDAIDTVNSHLPDYAQIKANLMLSHSMTFEEGLYTANMRPKREQINQYYQSRIEAIYANFFTMKKEEKNTMSLYQRLLNETTTERDYLLSSPIIKRCFSGDIETEDYVAFLSQAYHHVKHTVPLLMSVGSRLPESKEWLREAVAEYIEEELGHQEWVLNDIANCGYDKEVVRATPPSMATELMVAYAYDMVNRVNPLGFFGMVHVLEGTSIAMADNAAANIKDALGLPKKAFSYLVSHGSLDIDHVKFFETLMDKIDCPKEQDLIVQSAKRFYVLYGNIFRTLDVSASKMKAA